ncbi:MAG TPA: response regulator [Nitrospirota bacterium]|nr:response regulator [Nitrospirota bacterium]
MHEKLRVLCVDDEENILRALQRLFFDAPYDVIAAASGDEGLRLLETTPSVQVVISDYRMPGMNGAHFLRAVSERWPDTVRILLSGYADVASVIDAVNEGSIYRFVPKPWNDDELKVSVANAMERWRLGRENKELTERLSKANVDLQALNVILQERITDEVVLLKKQNKMLESSGEVLNALPLAVACLDGDGWITYYNRAAGRLFSWTDDNMIYMPRDKAFPAPVNDRIGECMKSGSGSVYLEVNGKRFTARSERAVNGAAPGTVLIFEECSAEPARRTA